MENKPLQQPQKPPKANAEEGGRAAFWGDIDSPADDAWAKAIWQRMLKRAGQPPANQ